MTELNTSEFRTQKNAVHMDTTATEENETLSPKQSLETLQLHYMKEKEIQYPLCDIRPAWTFEVIYA